MSLLPAGAKPPPPLQAFAAAAAAAAAAPPSSSPFSTQTRLSTLLGGTLESTLHELLYVRRIYPHTAFAPNRFLGVSCHAVRHSGVVDYIYNFLEVAVPALCCGTADEIALIVVDSPPGHPETIMERFVFGFDTGNMNGKMEEALRAKDGGEAKIGAMVRYLEPRLRDVLLQVVSMNGMDVRRPSRRKRGAAFSTSSSQQQQGAAGDNDPSGNMTFKLALRIAPASKDGDAGKDEQQRQEQKEEEMMQFPSPCAELDAAMKEAKWRQSGPSTCGFDGGPRPGRVPQEVTQTLKHMRAPSVGLNITLNMEVDPND